MRKRIHRLLTLTRSNSKLSASALQAPPLMRTMVKLLTSTARTTSMEPAMAAALNGVKKMRPFADSKCILPQICSSGPTKDFYLTPAHPYGKHAAMAVPTVVSGHM